MAAHQAFQGSLRERSQEITLAGAQDQRQKGSCCGRQSGGLLLGRMSARGRQSASRAAPSASPLLHLQAPRYMAGDGWNLKEGARALFVNMVPLILWPHFPQLIEGT